MMRLRNTLRIRFALWTAGLLLVGLVAFGAFVYVHLARSLTTSIDDSLRLSAAQAIAAVNVEDGEITFWDSTPEASVLDHLRARGLTIRVLAPDGRIIQTIGPYGTQPVIQTDVEHARQGQLIFTNLNVPTDLEPTRWYTAPISQDNQFIGIVQVAQSLDSVHETLEQLLAALLLGVPLLVIGAAIGGYILVERALAPIDYITRTAQRISANDLHARLNITTSDDEVGRLAATFDGMLARLDESFVRERQFTADASHELRTPLAAMQAILSVVRTRRRTYEEYERALDDLDDEAKRLRVLVENLLALARGDSGERLRFEKVNLTDLLEGVGDSLSPLAAAKDLTLRCDIDSDLVVLGDEDALIRLFINLLDNAVKYTEYGGIHLCAEKRDSLVQVTVADTGVGVAAEQLPHLFDRFFRVDTVRTIGGAGLGLAIVQGIVQAHGGTIAVQSTSGVGTTFTVGLSTTSLAKEEHHHVRT